MGALGGFLKIAGVVVFAGSGLWGLFLCLDILSQVGGLLAIIVGLIIGPLTFFAAPIYAGVSYGDWFPLFLNYGGGFVGAALFGIGQALSRS